ncbi:MAG: glutamate formimidoyltransferase [candidate division WOR-3 bacterium]
MARIVECVPNFSEGRRPEVIDKIVAAIQSVSGVTLLDREMNADHNRAVITFVGEPEVVVEAAFRAVKIASELIDLRTHKGEHPRIGATDVVPLVPISNVTTEECVELARRLGKRISDELGIPVYLYEAAATRPERQDLANIRKGEFEGLREEIRTNPDRAPDFGKPELHPSAGATVVGVRFPLIAYNINLETQDKRIADNIAKAIRFRNGGFRYVKALGFEIKEKNCVQVSINMTNYQATPLFRVFDTVKREAERYGVMIKESEIVGLVPQQALIDTAVNYLQLWGFSPNQILENRLTQAGKSLADFISDVASSSPTPGGGSCSALAGAIGTALLLMVANLTIGKKGYEAVADEIRQAKEQLEPIKNRFYNLITEDAQAFDSVMQAYKLPKTTDAEKAQRLAAICEANKKATEVPLATMENALTTLMLCQPIVAKGNKNSISDAGVALHYLNTAFEGARLNVLINLPAITDENFVKEKRTALTQLQKKAKPILDELIALVETRLVGE